jgi:transmembrane sensor
VVGLALITVVVSQPRTNSEAAVATAAKPAQPAAAVDALHLQLADGSEVWLHDTQARVRVDEVTPAHVALELQAGQAHFDVRHRENRVFRVRSGQVTVEVLGTAFELEREAARTRVLVSRGRVAVSWPGGRSELAAGEAGWFPRAAPITKDPTEAPLTAARTAKAPSRKSRVVSAQNAWREPAERGDFDHAYELLTDSGHTVADDVEELLLAADTARLSGHPKDALAFLRRVVEQHRTDSRAPLAAFTLGGVLMQQLGQPREAEAAFGRARELSLNASLAEDALARQVEAAYRAGDSARARALAREYLEQYPKGRRVHAVQRFGGLAR